MVPGRRTLERWRRRRSVDRSENFFASRRSRRVLLGEKRQVSFRRLQPRARRHNGSRRACGGEPPRVAEDMCAGPDALVSSNEAGAAARQSAASAVPALPGLLPVPAVPDHDGGAGPRRKTAPADAGDADAPARAPCPRVDPSRAPDPPPARPTAIERRRARPRASPRGGRSSPPAARPSRRARPGSRTVDPRPPSPRFKRRTRSTQIASSARTRLGSTSSSARPRNLRGRETRKTRFSTRVRRRRRSVAARPFARKKDTRATTTRTRALTRCASVSAATRGSGPSTEKHKKARVSNTNARASRRIPPAAGRASPPADASPSAPKSERRTRRTSRRRASAASTDGRFLKEATTGDDGRASRRERRRRKSRAVVRPRATSLLATRDSLATR